ncbi:glutamine synthetase-like [Oppia nitens]|uniref:glutamine synthetase-like n=1 Tax=Oppia nitens TaxID=1686743 RepID=UPI0023DC89FD|nr:glutamine synthetase-like [Oppia nitens]
MSSKSVSLISNQTFLAKFLSLDQPKDKIQVTYVYEYPGNRDSDGHYYPQLCAKTKVIDFVPNNVNDLPVWCSGSMYSFKEEVYMKPVRIYSDPFRGGNNKLVLCETYTDEMTPHPVNHRHSCNESMKMASDDKPWFGFEQEYILLDGNTNRPLGWPKGGYPKHPTELDVIYFQGIGANRVVGRDVVEAHFRACLYAGVNITGENAEGLLAQWEYQIGPSEGILLGDDVMMSRYILHRVAEMLNIVITFDPKPVPGWFGSGGHMNFSTAGMRAKGGITQIDSAVDKLSKRHAHHIKVYDPRGGLDNQRRLQGAAFTSKIDDFTSGVADRSTSVRIPKQVAQAGCGFIEDRRPASNCDPYQVTEALVRTCCLNE